jgi:hypothetical protein
MVNKKSLLVDDEKTTRNTTICVNRSVQFKGQRDIFPDFLVKFVYPDFQIIGLLEYDFKKQVKPWVHDGQKKEGGMAGTIILSYFEITGVLQNCLGLHDAVEIRKRNTSLFKDFFGNQIPFFWKSVAENRHGAIYVPYLDNEFTVRWCYVGGMWRSHYTAMFFDV